MSGSFPTGRLWPRASGAGARGSGRRFRLPLVLVAFCSALLLPTAGAAQTDSEEFATIEIEVIGRVPWNNQRPVRGRVTVETDRAVSGRLSVLNSPTGGNSATTYEFDVDLAAGTTASFPVTLTTGWDGIEATASITSNGETVASESIRVFGEESSDVPMVATWGIEDPPRRVAEVGSDLQIPTMELDRSLRGMEAASSLVTTRAAVGDLGPDSAELLRLEGWVRGGGQLVVADSAASLDDRYHQFPTANPNRFSYGSGTILYDEEWEDGIPLGGYLGSLGLQDLIESQNLGYGSSGELSVLADIALPAAALIIGALLIYTVLAGPVVFGVLSAKRAQRRIWVVLPALSLLFTAAVLGIGLLTRSSASEAHITIVEVNDRGSRATSNLLVTSNFGDNRTLETPDGWNYLGQGRSGGQRPALIRIGSSSTDISLDMPPGSNAVARVGGPAPQFDGDLSIGNMRLDGDELTADLTNNTAADLQETVALFGNARVKIGEVSAGQTVNFSVPTGDRTGRTMKELLLWPRAEQRWGENGPGAVPSDRDSITAAGSWTEWRIGQGAVANPENVVGVVGWTDQLASPVGDIEHGKTALYVRANVPTGLIESGFGTTARLPSRQVEPFFFENFVGYLEEYRVTLEPGYELDRLAMLANGQSAGLGLLIDGQWQYVDLPDEGEAMIRIPDAAVVDGEVMVRSYITDWGWGSGITALMVRDDDAQAQAFDFSPDLQLRNVGNRGFEDGPFDAAEEVEFAPVPVEPDLPTTVAEPPPDEQESDEPISTTTVPPVTSPDDDLTTITEPPATSGGG